MGAAVGGGGTEWRVSYFQEAASKPLPAEVLMFRVLMFRVVML